MLVSENSSFVVPVGLASHWSCITDSPQYPSMGHQWSEDGRDEHSSVALLLTKVNSTQNKYVRWLSR